MHSLIDQTEQQSSTDDRSCVHRQHIIKDYPTLPLQPEHQHHPSDRTKSATTANSRAPHRDFFLPERQLQVLCTCVARLTMRLSRTVNMLTMGAWLTLLLLSIMAAIVDCGTAEKLDAVSWHSNNPIFQADNNNHVIPVSLGDNLDFVCPYSVGGILEYYVIYQVTKEEYENCVLTKDNPRITKKVVNCSKPYEVNRRFTLQILDFSPLRNFDFQPGSDYYFLTTSTGKAEGINTRNQGACANKNMKVILRVKEQISTERSRPPSSSTSRWTSTSTTSTTTTSTTTRRPTSRTTSPTTTSTTTTPSATSSTTPPTRKPVTTWTPQATTVNNRAGTSDTVNSSASAHASSWITCLVVSFCACVSVLRLL